MTTSLKLLTAIILLLSGCDAPPPEPSATAPPTRRDDVVDVVHGVEIVDSYRWLEDQDSPETRGWLDAQNAYTRLLLGDRPERPALERRLSELLRVDRVAAPIERRGRYFLWKKRAQDDLWILYLREGLEGEDRILIDPHPLSPDHTTSVDVGDVSADGKLLIYGIRRGGADETELRVLDVDSGEDLPDRLATALYRDVALAADKSGFYYSLQDRKTGIRVRYHALGTDPAEDREVFGEGYGPGQWISTLVSDSGRYLLFEVNHGWDRSELHFLDAAAGGPVMPLVDDLDARFSPAFAGDLLFVQTDWEAPKGRILRIDLEAPDRSTWEEIVAEGEDAIEGFSLVGGQLFVRTLHNVISRIDRFDLAGGSLG